MTNSRGHVLPRLRRTVLGFGCVSLLGLTLGGDPVSAEVCGDPDDSGTITVTDGVQILRGAAGLSSLCTGRVCDMDGTGQVTVSDGVTALRRAAGLSSRVSCGAAIADVFGELTKTGSVARLHLGNLPSPTAGAVDAVTAIDGPQAVLPGDVGTFAVTLAPGEGDLIVGARDALGRPLDGFFQLSLEARAAEEIVQIGLSVLDSAPAVFVELLFGSTTAGGAVSPTKPKGLANFSCAQVFLPVCGVDGQTYSNECFAALNGVTVDHDGACP
jgi:hypothetical protein